MTVSTRDLPGARLRRWLWHGALGAAALLAIWAAVSGASRREAAGRSLQQAQASLAEHTTSADAVASECSIARFSEEKSLEKFPMPVPSYATKKESDCLRKVTEARSSLIEDYSRIGAARKALEEARRSAGRRAWLAWILSAGFVVAFYVTEIHTRPRTRRMAAAGAAAGAGAAKGRHS